MNEGHLIKYLDMYEFEIIDFENLSINEQIQKIQSAKRILGPHGSGFTNLVFSNSGSKVLEIMGQKYDNIFKKNFLKYKRMSEFKKNDHLFYNADLVANELKDQATLKKIGKYIDINVVKENSYYMNFIVKDGDFKKLIENFSSH